MKCSIFHKAAWHLDIASAAIMHLSSAAPIRCGGARVHGGKKRAEIVKETFQQCIMQS
jgi:hypothetical protein